MNKLHILLTVILIGVVVISACARAPATERPGDDAVRPPAATDPPVLTDVPIAPAETQTLVPVPIVLSGPAMEVGSMFSYIDGGTLVAVPGGEFIMGQGGEDNPTHRVNLSAFWFYRAKVTNSQYAFCVSLGKCTPPDTQGNEGYSDPLKANHPVTGVNHDQAASYCSFVNGRLPTEAEWEKTARGPEGNLYPWGDATPSCELANFGSCEFRTTSVVDHPGGMSFYEALDMAGNVYEWVADWYEANYYLNSPVDDPLGPDVGYQRSVRSSSFNSAAFAMESARRSSLAPTEARDDLGFRCVVEDPIFFAPFCQAALVYGSDAAPGAPGGGGTLSETCPNVGISVVPVCLGQVGSANVNFSGPAGSIIDSDGCAPTGNLNQYSCTLPTTVSIKADCQQSVPGSPTCPAGFTLQASTCVSQGRAGQCLPGFNYDPIARCCTALPGQDSSVSLPQCPVGTYYLPTQNSCLPYPAQGIVSAVSVVGIPNCIAPTRRPGGGGGPPPTNCASFGADMTLCLGAGCTWDGTSCS